jgi:hypothetical protein
MVMASASAFRDIELAVGTDEVITVQIRNDGLGPLSLENISVRGADATSFEIADGGDPGTLAPGAARDVQVRFVPSSEGTKAGVLSIESNDPSGRVEIAFSGVAARYQYKQVDRMGIPGLNTVFNHPSGIGGFSKTAYNVASPANDLASYRAVFEVVLGAVGNADPAATAALLLPDELPVSMGVTTTAFGSLTGRALTDDAVDVALSVVVGIASLQSDNVNANDRPFRTTFPYVALPNN